MGYKKYTQKDHREAQYILEKGGSQCQAAREVGCHPTTIHNWIKEDILHQAHQKSRSRPTYTDEHHQHAERLLWQGKGTADVAEEIGCRSQTIRRWVSKGLVRRPPKAYLQPHEKRGRWYVSAAMLDALYADTGERLVVRVDLPCLTLAVQPSDASPPRCDASGTISETYDIQMAYLDDTLPDALNDCTWLYTGHHHADDNGLTWHIMTPFRFQDSKL